MLDEMKVAFAGVLDEFKDDDLPSPPLLKILDVVASGLGKSLVDGVVGLESGAVTGGIFHFAPSASPSDPSPLGPVELQYCHLFGFWSRQLKYDGRPALQLPTPAGTAAANSKPTQGDLSKDPPAYCISDLRFSPTEDYLSVASWDKKVRIYEIANDGPS
ncbi:hypothetical protein M409DRAFT_25539 [Zasmidium cellare ATCC 36951]|uniref:Uncharacterized protein n=1 Tax=Zasmidium cellare ATCC 36951 TaxID=1080233 RepID=A0A6A6CFL4_ZASCE|nr:uncharacterized protein M409DRAFT_25539 [Zasmidium cellare ATCC 36951]KAF2164196.1 hypothetical protein M409DRAFT_25539 [Zasmidium cellare ATCC 36951]